MRGGRPGRSANGSQQGSEAPHAPPAGSQELPASANRARGRFPLKGSPSVRSEPRPRTHPHPRPQLRGPCRAPWPRKPRSVVCTKGRRQVATGSTGVSRGSLHRNWDAGNRGQGRGREGGAVRPAEKPLVRVWPQGAELQPILMATGWSGSVFWRGLLSPRQWAMAAVSQGAVGAGAAPREHRKQGDLAPVLGPQVRGQREGPGGCRCPLACATCSGACPRGLWLPPHAPVSGFPSYKDTGHRIGPT